MSLNYIGISHFPVLHRQFSSPTATVSLDPSPIPSQDLTQDNKDVLLERLNDLVLRLSKDRSVEDSTISAIHTGVDRIELLLKAREKGGHKKPPSVGNDVREDTFWAPLSPTRNVMMRFPDSPISRHAVTREATISTERAIEIAKSAEELASRVSATVVDLQVRREESDVSPSLLPCFKSFEGSRLPWNCNLFRTPG
jgi:hypothetical protein